MTFTVLWKNYLVHIIDILLVAYLFYRVILLIKGTRAVQMLIGIIIIAVATIFFKNVIHLKTFSWLLENFWLAAAVIIAITFQPELRQALAELGGEPLKRIFVTSELKLMTDIIPAISELSEKETGALIVFEQETGLKNIIETGTRIDGIVSKELIMNIFAPKSVLHDGAIIIRGSRIVAAGCILPVSASQSLERTFGTRHRAAVGLSEISDAISVVVSEETGQISLVYGNKIEQNVTIDDLQKHLKEIYIARVKKTLLHKNDSTKGS
ncbi:MAG: diadenylate cyclase CdaA [Elusimicrobiota bacterium]